MIQQCVDSFVLRLLTLCLKVRTDYTNLFPPNDFKKNDDTVLKYLMSNTYL